MAFFVVGFDTVVCANVFDSLNGFVVFGLLDQAGAHVDDVMASLLIESRDESAFPFSYRHLCFVSVVPRVFHAECRVHGDFERSSLPMRSKTSLTCFCLNRSWPS